MLINEIFGGDQHAARAATGVVDVVLELGLDQAHHHPHDHAHEHGACTTASDGPSDGAHQHHHGHGATPDEKAIIEAFLAVCDATKRLRAAACAGISSPLAYEEIPVKIFLDLIRKVSGVVDLYEHNQDFKKACNSLEIVIKAGRYASHNLDHAYVIKASQEPGDIFTIQTNLDLDSFSSDIAVKYADLDLFQKDDK